MLAELRKGGPRLFHVAQLLAVLDEAVSLPILAQILDMDIDSLREVIGELTDAKLIGYTEFRRRDLREAVLRETPLSVRKRLRRRAAEVLHDREAPDTRVADQLLGADDIRFPWAVPVLRRAAVAAIAEDQVSKAIDYLELAWRLTRDGSEGAVILLIIAIVRWRLNPSTANRSFARLVTALRSGAIPVQCLPTTARYLLWHGRLGEARIALRMLDDAASAGEKSGVAARGAMQEWLSCNYPGLLKIRDNPSADSATILLSARFQEDSALFPQQGWAEPDEEAARLLLDVFANDASDSIVARAERLIREHRLDDTTLGALLMALDALIYIDRLDVAGYWCEALMLEATARRAPAWRSIFAIWRSAILLREGKLEATIELGDGALVRVRDENLGNYVGLAVAALVSALTAAGRYQEAAGYLDIELPETVLNSRVALPWLRARGQYMLATNNYEQAYADFAACGERMQRWNMDIPGLMAWRNDLAMVSLAQGDRHGAHQWALAHLTHLGSVTKHSSSGVSLRLIAATDLCERHLELRRLSVDLASAGNDTFELATALADLAQTYRSLGERDRARAATRRALLLAEQCGAEPLQRRLAGTTHSQGSLIETERTDRTTETLSPAELKVARLVATGRRNRDVARELHITPSTVEQHLTRIYRKVGVHRRADLMMVLGDPAQWTMESEAS
ncbi:LuxR C-terminal-related transcriptional regulator [Nocardia salmonicida]|uniref:LuxR C-terminal-related transcriptional regulator n=2 Tax=Nocardia salmonicida TaxID=53431 RepID=UPI0036566533